MISACSQPAATGERWREHSSGAREKRLALTALTERIPLPRVVITTSSRGESTPSRTWTADAGPPTSKPAPDVETQRTSCSSASARLCDLITRSRNSSPRATKLEATVAHRKSSLRSFLQRPHRITCPMHASEVQAIARARISWANVNSIFSLPICDGGQVRLLTRCVLSLTSSHAPHPSASTATKYGTCPCACPPARPVVVGARLASALGCWAAGVLRGRGSSPLLSRASPARFLFLRAVCLCVWRPLLLLHCIDVGSAASHRLPCLRLSCRRR